MDVSMQLSNNEYSAPSAISNRAGLYCMRPIPPITAYDRCPDLPLPTLSKTTEMHRRQVDVLRSFVCAYTFFEPPFIPMPSPVAAFDKMHGHRPLLLFMRTQYVRVRAYPVTVVRYPICNKYKFVFV